MLTFKSRIIINNDDIKFCYKCGKPLKKADDEGGFDLLYCSECKIKIFTHDEIFCENHNGYIDHKGFHYYSYDTTLKCSKCKTNLKAFGYTCSCGEVHEIQSLECPKCAEEEFDKEMEKFMKDSNEFVLNEELDKIHEEDLKIQKELEEKYAYNKKRAIKT